MAERLTDATRIQEMIVATSAVTLLVLGGLSMVSAMFELFSFAPKSELRGVTKFLGPGFAMLASLGIYEVTYFTCITALGLWPWAPLSEDFYALLVTAAALLFLILAALLRTRRQGHFGNRPSSSRWDKTQITFSVIAGGTAVLSYLIIPTSTIHTPQGPLSWPDYAAALLNIGATLSTIGFLIASARHIHNTYAVDNSVALEDHIERPCLESPDA